MAHIRSSFSAALVATISCLAVALTTSPAAAERVVLTDGTGESESTDIASVAVHHKAKRISFAVDMDAMAGTFVWMRVDTPDGKKWEHMVSFDNLSSAWVHVHTRKNFREDWTSWTCRVKPTTEDPGDGVIYRFSFARRCFETPEKLRVKLDAEDRDSGDRTTWSDWAKSA